MNRQQSTSISGKHHPENHKGEGSTPSARHPPCVVTNGTSGISMSMNVASPPTPSIPDEVGAEMLAGVHAQALPRHRNCVLDQEQRGTRHVDRPDAAPELKLGVGLAHPRFILLVRH